MNIIGQIDPSAFASRPRMHHRLDEYTQEFPSSAGSRPRGLLALKAMNWRVAKKGPVNPWSGLNAFRVVIDDDYRTFEFPMCFYSHDDGQHNILTTAIILAEGCSEFTIDWGDGTSNVYTDSTKQSQISHTYQANGEYDISISNDIDSFALYAKSPTPYQNTHVTRIHNIASKATFSPFFWKEDTHLWSFFFAGCTALESVDMSESSITEIYAMFGDWGRFDGQLKNLRELIIPRTLVSIDNRAFYSFTGWDYSAGIDLPRGLENVGLRQGLNIFRNTPFAYVHLPDTVKSFNGHYHFYLDSYPVIIDAVVPPTIANGNVLASFRGKFYVPDESVEAYRSSQYWSSFASSILPRSEYTGPIGES